MKSRLLIKLGGAALQEASTLDILVKSLIRARAKFTDVILVHGGGPAINQELRRRGIDWTFVGGQRVTSAAMMDVIESVLCGQVNQRVVRHLGASGLPAVGLSGADHQTLLCGQASPDLGMVGKIEHVSCEWIEGVLQLPSRPIPVVAPIGVGRAGERYNVNADWAASHLAAALNADELIFLTDQNGILDEEGQLISNVDQHGLKAMIDAQMVTGGMLTKTLAILNALSHGVSSVRVLKGIHAAEAIEVAHLGTVCVTNPHQETRLESHNVAL